MSLPQIALIFLAEYLFPLPYEWYKSQYKDVMTNGEFKIAIIYPQIPNLSKLQAGDIVYEKKGLEQLLELLVVEVDPIQLYVTVDNNRRVHQRQLLAERVETTQQPLPRKRARKARKTASSTSSDFINNPAPFPKPMPTLMPLELKELDFF